MSDGEVEHTVRGEEGGECQYEDCQNSATALVRFEETKPTVHTWMCGPHAGNSLKKHDDAEVVESAE